MTEASAKPQLIGSVQERRPSSSASPTFKSSIHKTGFPAVQHRSKSTFARSREAQQKASYAGRSSEPPLAVSGIFQKLDDKDKTNFSGFGKRLRSNDVDQDWRIQINEENKRKVESMTEEELELEQKEILERFGTDVGDILKRVREAREAKEQNRFPGSAEIHRKPLLEEPQVLDSSFKSALKVKLPSQVPTPSTSRPSSRADRKLRFADVKPDDVHVYESAPPSPRKKPLALPPPSDETDFSAVPLILLGDNQTSKPPTKSNQVTKGFETMNKEDEEPETGTPEDIRRRYFPNQPALEPALDWIRPSQTSKDETDSGPSTSTLRFDLNGKVIPTDLQWTLPTHLGLHHHADGEYAGYALDDVFLLSRSTVPAQRSSMLGVLARIARQLGRNAKGDFANGIQSLKGNEDALRKRILAAGIEAMRERGSVSAMAIEVIWECLVCWDELQSIEGVELKQLTKSDSTSSADEDVGKSLGGDIITSLPLQQYVLPHISDAFVSASLPQKSLSQLLSILHRLAQHTNEIAEVIVTTPGLISNLSQMLILTPIPPTQSSLFPNPDALNLLRTLASASRINAAALTAPADALLRFIAFLPSSSSYPPIVATSLLTTTLQFYAMLASYGMYSHIATAAAPQFSQLNQYVLSTDCNSQTLRKAWLELVQAWIVCATDPHKTSPSHEILWSQISAWSWGLDVLACRVRLTAKDSVVWVAFWRCISAWLEGARVNGIRGGENERLSVVNVTKPGFDDGVEKEVVTTAFKGLQDILDSLDIDEQPGVGDGSLENLRLLAEHADVLATSLRLWLACIPSSEQGVKLESPPFSLPFPQLAALSARVVNHPMWSRLYSEKATSYAHVYCRSLSLFLSYYLRLSRRLPTTSDDLWLAQAFVVIRRFISGDEDSCQQVVEELINLVSPNVTAIQRVVHPLVFEAIAEGGGMNILLSFLLDAFKPQDTDIRLGSSCISPKSISESTTQRLPPAYLAGGRQYPLPLPRDWVFTPLNHLLRSGSSRVFNSLPASWNGSEVGIVRATLLLSKVMQEALSRHRLQEWELSMAETAFGCMKVFMLEHEQQNANSADEVFRDGIVQGLMEDLLGPFRVSASNSPIVVSSPTSGFEDRSLEAVACRFLGHSTPFFQYYTDFVSLYDAISFGHPIFGRLLIIPTSMMYPIDFRKYLWGDYGHVLSTMRTKPDEVLVEMGESGGLSEYFWPVEKDAQVLGSYLRALVTQGTLVDDGFMRWIAVHHVACNIWGDFSISTPDDELSPSQSPSLLGEENGRERRDLEKAGRLLKAVVDQAGFEVVRDVVKYVQNRLDGQPLLVPPECFDKLDAGRGEQRLEFIQRVGGDNLRERLRLLFE